MPLPITLAPVPVHLVSCAYINLSPVQFFHYFCRPAWHSSNVPGCKSYAVWNIRSILWPPPTGFPAGHQVYDLHNDGNSVLQLGRVSHRSVSRRQMGLPTRYYGCTSPIFVVIHVEKRGIEAKFFVAGCPLCHQPAGITRWTSSFLLSTKTPEQGRGITPFTSALQHEYPDDMQEKYRRLTEKELVTVQMGNQKPYNKGFRHRRLRFADSVLPWAPTG